tara:strand:+ start:16813 stop:17748 length:936 start_codon:yes stop_codon:yes gene_type:complete
MSDLKAGAPFQHSGRNIPQLMQTLLYALLPGILASLWFFGFGILVNIAIAVLFAVFAEAAMPRLRNRNIRSQLSDRSVCVTAVLFAAAIPPESPGLLVALGIVFAVVIAKHLYGGLGQNPFNPAMCGYAMLLLAFPLEMTGTILTTQESAPPLFASGSETAWKVVNISYLLGGLFILYKKIISWHIPLAIIATILVLSAVFYAPGSIAIYGTPYLHLFGSATMIGVFFIATDPVSAATTRPGKLIYGIIIGASIYSIRVWGSYLDSIAFAVLFGNFCAPLLDHYCRPRIFGHGLRGKSGKQLPYKAPINRE